MSKWNRQKKVSAKIDLKASELVSFIPGLTTLEEL